MRRPRLIALVLAVLAGRMITPWWCGLGADRWLDGDPEVSDQLAAELIAFEARDDRQRTQKSGGRFEGEWALVTHQMIALGLAQIAMARPERKAELAPLITKAALKSWTRPMRDFGTKAWGGEDVLESLDGPHGHAYFGYPSLAIGMARLLDPDFPPARAAEHDRVIAAYERRLLASPTGLIETYPNEAYPTDVAAVAAAIAVHGRATGADHHEVLTRWAEHVKRVQIDRDSGFVVQRMSAKTGQAHDSPRGSGTGLAAYFAGFADRKIAEQLASALFTHESSWWGFSGIREYAEGHQGRGDVDSGPVVLGVSVAATGFALAPARSFGRRDVFERLYRTVTLFGMPMESGSRFAAGGPIGNALLLAMLTSGPELAP